MVLALAVKKRLSGLIKIFLTFQLNMLKNDYLLKKLFKILKIFNQITSTLKNLHKSKLLELWKGCHIHHICSLIFLHLLSMFTMVSDIFYHILKQPLWNSFVGVLLTFYWDGWFKSIFQCKKRPQEIRNEQEMCLLHITSSPELNFISQKKEKLIYDIESGFPYHFVL